jgi:hypothetical protein
MDNTQIIILAVACFIAGFGVAKTWFAIYNEFLIYRNGYIHKVGETPPDEPWSGYYEGLKDPRDPTATKEDVEEWHDHYDGIRHGWFDAEDYNAGNN